jgi:hypothetical protein
LPKVRGNPGELHRAEFSPWSYGSLEHQVGRVGPRAQARYVRSRPPARLVARWIGVLMACTALGAAIALVLR